VTKLQFIRTIHNLFTSADEERRHLMKMMRESTTIVDNYNARITRKETQIRVPLFSPPVYMPIL